MHCTIRSVWAISSASAYGAGESNTSTVKPCLPGTGGTGRWPRRVGDRPSRRGRRRPSGPGGVETRKGGGVCVGHDGEISSAAGRWRMNVHSHYPAWLGDGIDPGDLTPRIQPIARADRGRSGGGALASRPRGGDHYARPCSCRPPTSSPSPHSVRGRCGASCSARPGRTCASCTGRWTPRRWRRCCPGHAPRHPRRGDVRRADRVPDGRSRVVPRARVCPASARSGDQCPPLQRGRPRSPWCGVPLARRHPADSRC